MDKLVAMRTFCRVVDRGGFAAAAADLELSNAAVSKHVRELEEELGTALLVRTTRRIALTEAGAAYFESCTRILDSIEAAELEIGAQLEPKGRLRINAPMTLGLLHLAPLLAEFTSLYPQVRVDLSLNDRFVDLVEEGFDVGLRVQQSLEDSSLISRRLCTISRVLVGAPAYLERVGEPRTPADLKDHKLLVYSFAEQTNRWTFFSGTERHDVNVEPFIRANSGLALRAPLVAGVGLTLTPTFTIGDELRTGQVRTVMSGFLPSPFSLHVMYPPSRTLAPKARVFVDFVATRLSDPPPWDRDNF